MPSVAPALWIAYLRHDEPADVRVVEKRIPTTVLLGHGLGAALLIACVVAVGLRS